MRKKILLCFYLGGIIFITGCAPQKMYYFGNYSQSLYSYKKNQNEETLINHKQVLEKIVSESGIKKIPVPPGIYAELGYINMKTNHSKEAIRLYNAESQLYPESKLLMGRLIQSAKTKKNTDSNGPEIPPSSIENARK